MTLPVRLLSCLLLSSSSAALAAEPITLLPLSTFTSRAAEWLSLTAPAAEPDSVVLCSASPDPRTCSAFLVEKRSMVSSAVVGVRFFVVQGHAENWSALDSYRLVSGRTSPFSPGSLAQLDLGYAFVF